ncbi:MAG TPA: choice-of-anchor X domain-containing protein [Blastocatellia bacterium]|nr:choice-of-anchor X domain-containing protein [Blastocatellia bacterium]
MTTGSVEAFASAEHDGVQLNVSVTKATLMFPEVVEIQATPTFAGENVTGATVSSTVTRPDVSKLQIALFDDGNPSHGDTAAGDGIYAAQFNQYKGDGVYTFDVKVVSSNGTTHGGENLFAVNPSNAKLVPSFTRMSTTTAIVTGVPVITYDVCVQDDSNGNMLQFNTGTGDYQFTRCSSGFSLTGTGVVTIKGSIITLQHNAADRRVLAQVDNSVKNGKASVQVFSLGTTFTVTDRNTTNNTCSCP